MESPVSRNKLLVGGARSIPSFEPSKRQMYSGDK